MRFLVGLLAIIVSLGCKQKPPEVGRQSPPAQAVIPDSATTDSTPATKKILMPAPPPKSIPPMPTSAPVPISADLQMIAEYAFGQDSLRLDFVGEEKYRPGKYKYLAFSGYGSSVWLDTVEVDIKNDSISSFYSDGSMGTVISMAITPYHLACFRATAGLEAGAVKTWYLNKAWSDTRAEPPEWVRLSDSTRHKTLDLPELGTTEFFVTFESDPDTTEDGELDLSKPFHWNMKIGSDPASVFPSVSEPWVDPSYSSADEAVLWIGDLDRDGKPDVLMSPVLGPGKGGRLYQLFLSRSLVVGEEWKAAAEFSYYPPTMGD